MRTLFRVSAALCLGAVTLGLVMQATGDETGLLVAESTGVLSACVLPIFWLTNRQRYRTDANGLHHHGLLRERVIPWEEVTSLSVYRPSYVVSAASTVYYHVHSARGTITIPDAVTDLDALCAVIENATRLTWQAEAA